MGATRDLRQTVIEGAISRVPVRASLYEHWRAVDRAYAAMKLDFGGSPLYPQALLQHWRNRHRLSAQMLQARWAR